MARYSVKSGYCLHLPHNAFAHAGEEVELSGDLEKAILKNQGWKVEAVHGEPDRGNQKLIKPEEKEVHKPPQDRAIKEAKAK